MRFFLRLLALSVLIVFGFAGWLAWFAVTPLQFSPSPHALEIQRGSSLRMAANDIARSGLDLPAWQFALLGRVVGRASAVKAGSYEIESGITPWLLLEKLTRGDVTQADIVLVEGKTFRDYRRILDAHPDLRHDTQSLSDADILQRIGAVETHPEGLFFPDTYLFNKKSSDLEVLRRAYQAMQQRLTAEWAARDPLVPYASPYEALILASIVEKETGRAEDRPLVASVFVNRLRRGMALQTDPTVIYGLGANFDGNLKKHHLTDDNPYNTYTRAGLPPTPISMPGLASLHWVLHPLESDKLYFVARGDGSSVFSRTLDEHNRAVAQFQKKRGGR